MHRLSHLCRKKSSPLAPELCPGHPPPCDVSAPGKRARGEESRAQGPSRQIMTSGKAPAGPTSGGLRVGRTLARECFVAQARFRFSFESLSTLTGSSYGQYFRRFLRGFCSEPPWEVGTSLHGCALARGAAVTDSPPWDSTLLRSQACSGKFPRSVLITKPENTSEKSFKPWAPITLP